MQISNLPGGREEEEEEEKRGGAQGTSEVWICIRGKGLGGGGEEAQGRSQEKWEESGAVLHGTRGAMEA